MKHLAQIAVVLAAGLMFTGCKKEEAAAAPAEAPAPAEIAVTAEPAAVEAPMEAAPADSVVDPNAPAAEPAPDAAPVDPNAPPADAATESEDMPHSGGDKV
jgi:PBP1b-binding outer membrane lipoprotein LpoB